MLAVSTTEHKSTASQFSTAIPSVNHTDPPVPHATAAAAAFIAGRLLFRMLMSTWRDTLAEHCHDCIGQLHITIDTKQHAMSSFE